MSKGMKTITVTDDQLTDYGKTLVASAAVSAPADEETAELAVDNDQTGETEGETYRTFTDQPIALLGSPTSDGRMLAAGIELSFRSFPIPLMWCEQSSGGHNDSFTVGVIEDARVEGDHVLASGYLLNTEQADKAAYENAHGVSNPSIDMASAEWAFTDENGNVLDEDALWERFDSGEPIFETYTKGEIIGTTLVSTPAFDTRLSLNGERESRDVAVVAGAAESFRPRVYDHRMFAAPNLRRPTHPTMGDDGRIYGHLATWDVAHRSIQHARVLPPKSPSNYDNFHTTPPIKLDNGERLAVGRLTVGTGHADIEANGIAAMAHYDNTGTCFALVRVYETDIGIEFSGVAAPWATPEQIEMGLSAPLSGDWRDFGRGRDLIAALAVNTPGFPIRGRDDVEGRPVALLASAGRLPSRARRGDVSALSKSEITDAVAAGIALAEQRRQEVELAASLKAQREAALARAAAAVGKPKTAKERAAALFSRAQDQFGDALAAMVKS